MESVKKNCYIENAKVRHFPKIKDRGTFNRQSFQNLITVTSPPTPILWVMDSKLVESGNIRKKNRLDGINTEFS